MQSKSIVAHLWAAGLVLAAPAASQAIVVPAELAAAEGDGGGFWALTPFDSRGQVLIDGRHLTAAVGKKILAIVVRRNGRDASAAAKAGRLWIELSLSHANRGVESASAVFTLNRGTDPQVVFRGYVDVPASPALAQTPSPWSAPHVVRLGLQTPFDYRGGTLCVESETRLVAPNDTVPPSPPDWTPDMTHAPVTGSAAPTHKGCIKDMPDPAAYASTLSLGDTAVLSLNGNRQSGVALVGLGSVPLNLPLDAQGAPGCTLTTAWFLTAVAPILPMPAGPTGMAVFDLPLPAMSSLAGARLLAQWVVVDPGANRLGLTFSNGLDIVLGRPVGRGIAMIESPSATATSGRVVTHVAPVLRIEL